MLCCFCWVSSIPDQQEQAAGRAAAHRGCKQLEEGFMPPVIPAAVRGEGVGLQGRTSQHQRGNLGVGENTEELQRAPSLLSGPLSASCRTSPAGGRLEGEKHEEIAALMAGTAVNEIGRWCEGRLLKRGTRKRRKCLFLWFRLHAHASLSEQLSAQPVLSMRVSPEPVASCPAKCFICSTCNSVPFQNGAGW